MGAYVDYFGGGGGKKGSEYGMFFNELDADGYATDVTLSAENFKANHFGSSATTSGITMLSKAKKIEVIGETIGGSAFKYLLSSLEVACKTKIKAKSIGVSAFGNWGKTGAGIVSYWIPKECETISVIIGDNKPGPFDGNRTSNKIYCEVGSKPSGWGAGWANYAQYYPLTVTWGVTEEQFDAL